jgi:pimeloyl-ACP methyl ester carboxylesterase
MMLSRAMLQSYFCRLGVMHKDEPDWRAGGHDLRLSDGITHWRREGPPESLPIVLVHGATVPSWEFDALVPPLLRAGFQTLRFDLYGHGASDRPAGDYTFERFTRQVIEIIEATDFPRPAILLGHSFGAALVAAVVAARPDLAARLVLVAPMLDFKSTSAWAKVFRYPVLGELAMHFIGVPALIRRRRRRYAGIGKPHLTPRFIEQVTYVGFGRGLLSMFRTAALGDQGARYSGLHAVSRDILVITGDHDLIIPAEHVARVRSLLPPHSHCPVPGEHNLLLTHPEVVVEALVDWTARTKSGSPIR